ERVIMIAPFFPERIVHHSIINVLGRYWTNFFIAHTYACIKGRGIHKCMEDEHTALIIVRIGTRFCLNIDIKKFYDNIDHAALKRL
ncbi:reverse transcriptase, partial [Phocaeicola vulgatus]|nr:reverse transcriptase [Phocaeicola vulgatus]